jgi:hypothetical protein
MSSLRSSHYTPMQSSIHESVGVSTDPDNSLARSTIASVHESEPDSDDSTSSSSDSEDVEVTTSRVPKTTTTWEPQRTASKRPPPVCAAEIYYKLNQTLIN